MCLTVHKNLRKTSDFSHKIYMYLKAVFIFHIHTNVVRMAKITQETSDTRYDIYTRKMIKYFGTIPLTVKRSYFFLCLRHRNVYEHACSISYKIKTFIFFLRFNDISSAFDAAIYHYYQKYTDVTHSVSCQSLKVPFFIRELCVIINERRGKGTVNLEKSLTQKSFLFSYIWRVTSYSWVVINKNFERDYFIIMNEMNGQHQRWII